MDKIEFLKNLITPIQFPDITHHFDNLPEELGYIITTNEGGDEHYRGLGRSFILPNGSIVVCKWQPHNYVFHDEITAWLFDSLTDEEKKQIEEQDIKRAKRDLIPPSIAEQLSDSESNLIRDFFENRKHTFSMEGISAELADKYGIITIRKYNSYSGFNDNMTLPITIDCGRKITEEQIKTLDEYFCKTIPDLHNTDVYDFINNFYGDLIMEYEYESCMLANVYTMKIRQLIAQLESEKQAKQKQPGEE